MVDAKVKSDVLASVDSLADELVKIVVDTVKIPSINPAIPGQDYDKILGGETKVAEYLKPVMEGMGLEVDMFEVEAGRANIVGVCKGTGGGKSLIFNGHMDVVPPDPIEDWTEAGPWSGEIIDGKIYGRGSTDMKGGNTAAIIGLKAVLAAGYKPKGDVILQNVVGEEWMNTEIGTGAVIERGYRADAGIVVEATSFPYRLAISPASGNALIFNVTIKGKAVHCLLRGETIRAGGLGARIGVSALDKSMIIYEGLRRLEDEWGQTKSHPLWTRPGWFVIYPSEITGGPGGPSLISAENTLTYVVHAPPQEPIDQVKKEVEEEIRRLAETDSWLRENPPQVEWLMVWPSFDVPVDAPICQAVATAYEAALDQEPKYHGYCFADDGTFLNQAGIPTITIGPGVVTTLHAANEYVEIDELVDAAKVYALTIVEWCGV